MASVDQQFNTLNDKLQQLLKQYNRLQKENERLREELLLVRNREAEMARQVEELQQHISIMKISSGDMSDKDKKEFLANAYALLFPIDWPEPFGLVIIEAMACGTPVIAFRCGSIRHFSIW